MKIQRPQYWIQIECQNFKSQSLSFINGLSNFDWQHTESKENFLSTLNFWSLEFRSVLRREFCIWQIPTEWTTSMSQWIICDVLDTDSVTALWDLVAGHQDNEPTSLSEAGAPRIRSLISTWQLPKHRKQRCPGGLYITITYKYTFVFKFTSAQDYS